MTAVIRISDYTRKQFTIFSPRQKSQRALLNLALLIQIIEDFMTELLEKRLESKKEKKIFSQKRFLSWSSIYEVLLSYFAEY